MVNPEILISLSEDDSGTVSVEAAMALFWEELQKYLKLENLRPQDKVRIEEQLSGIQEHLAQFGSVGIAKPSKGGLAFTIDGKKNCYAFGDARLMARESGGVIIPKVDRRGVPQRLPY